ncbi:hypothetical protein BC332_32072 [Capsicum chinense]|uniref:C2 domain-containing protein n=1 Tax=Capsicum annuum TaxID=4072 RepID=A0A1U8HFP9_CAPAN|nr:protein SRC2-like [Capsicum annuum]KAF3630753.1 putative autophagy-related protein 18a-like [Capsicum annuum]KAF3635826.1 putative autophagy-related protein 18a-like [Capsicum annuum]PHT61684.1 hypothetical protein T459_34473 [Capsicum annuum]PHT98924.1 hypothetical protein BC332_32072 [Capsicum chinense]
MDWRPFDVTVISAAGIKNVNYFFVMDVYVETSIVGYAKNTKRTYIDKKGGTSPKWNYPMKFTLDEPSLTKPGLSLCFRIRSQRFLGDKDIGFVSIPINDIFGQSGAGPDGSAEKVVEYQVFTPVSGNPKGTLKFSYKFGKKYCQGQPSDAMYKGQPNGAYNENALVPVMAYPYPQNGTNNNNVPQPGMGYGTPNPNYGTAYQPPPPAGYPPPVGGGYNAGGYPLTGYPQQAGYGYPQQQPQQQQQVYGGYPQQQPQQQRQVYGGYPQQQQVQAPKKKSKMGMGAGVGLGLAGGLLGGMLIGDMVSDAGHDADAYEQGYDDAMDDMDY